MSGRWKIKWKKTDTSWASNTNRSLYIRAELEVSPSHQHEMPFLQSPNIIIRKTIHQSLWNCLQTEWEVYFWYITFPISHNNFPQSQNDYLRLFIPRQPAYLSCLLKNEAPPIENQCMACHIWQCSWCCSDCIRRKCLSTDCLRSSHQFLPFHWVRVPFCSHLAVPVRGGNSSWA